MEAIVAAHPLELEGLSGGVSIGVGLIEAALGMAEVLGKKPSGVILVGSCGAYRDFSIGDVVQGEEVWLAPDGELPDIVPTKVRPRPIHFPVPRAIVASTLGITVRKVKSEAQVENLEAFAVARACERANVPLAILLGVTNLVGPQGRAEWRANAKRMVAVVNDFVRNQSTPRSRA